MAEMENTCSLVRCMQEVPDLRAPYNQRHKFLDIIIIAVTARHPLRNGYLERVRTGHVPKKNGWGLLKLRSEKLREEGREEGRTLEIYSMVQDGDTSPERAARRLGITIPILKSRMIVSGYRYPEV